MASPQVRRAIRAHLAANWTATPIFSPNMNDDPVEGSPWVHVDFSGELYAQESIGASVQADNRWDEEGQLFIDVSVPQGSGDEQASEYAKALADMFRGLTLLSGALEFLDANIAPGGGDESGNWWTLPVTVRWRWMDAENT